MRAVLSDGEKSLTGYIAGQGEKRTLSSHALVIRNILSTGAALYLIFAVLFYPEPILHRSLAFGLFYAVIFISYTSPGTKSLTRVPFYDWMLAAAALGVSLYIALDINRIIDRIAYVEPLHTGDYIFGILTLALLLEGTRRIIGPWLPGISMAALVYLVFGKLIPGKFGHTGFSLTYIIEGMFLSGYGIWGSTMGIATGSIMVFIMFGVVFKNTGAGDFLFDFVNKIAGRSKGGVAKIAITASAMFGMVSGGALANVTTTGAMTIPAMKRGGYDGEYAACIESCASAGGILMPPIMGAVAFLMSEVVGIQYGELIRRAFIPALIYFAALYFAVDFRARRRNINGMMERSPEKFGKLLLRGYNFFIPLAYLVTRLMTGGIVARVGLETIVVMMVLGLFGRPRKVNLRMAVDSMRTSIDRGVMVVSTLATCGILVGVIDITGLTSKFTTYLMKIANISVPLTLFVLMILTLVLGLAMNISSSYLIAAVLGAPVLIGLGFEPLGVHMFILYYAAMATITPPVAITSFAAASIAEVPPMRVGFKSMKVGLVAYILPFAFIYSPAILLYGSIYEIILAVIAAFAGTGLVAMGLEGWFFGRKSNMFVRIGLVLAGILLVVGRVVPAITAGIIVSVIAVFHLIEKNIRKGELVNEKD